MARVKAVFFDLDDTLFDCSGSIVENARKRAAKAMVEAGLPCSAESAYWMQVRLFKKLGPMEDIFDRMCDSFGISKDEKRRIVKAGFKAYNSDEVENISLYPGVPETLDALKKKGIKLVLITSGIHERQAKKIRILGLEKKFDLVLIHDIERDQSKFGEFKRAMKQLRLSPVNVIVVGDKVSSEIKMANKLGMASVRILRGRFSKIKPRNELEEPDYSIGQISEVLPLLKKACACKAKESGLRVVAIGGGTGLPSVLEALKDYTKNITAIVTVTDSGRSSGRLRKEFRIPAPGDLRNCLVALSESENLMLDLFNYRFEGNTMLRDMSFGNLLIVALAKTTGSFMNGVKAASKILAIKGAVLPATAQSVHVCSELADGTIFCSEDALIQRNVEPARLAERAPIKRVFLKPGAKILPEARKAILEADLVVLGPGSLYTSVITNLLAKGMAEAIRKSGAKKVYVANVMTQVNQTHGFTLSRHVKEIEKYLGKGVLDFVLFNTRRPAKGVLERYRAAQSFFVENDLPKKNGKPVPVGADIIEKPPLFSKKLTKQQLLRHDSKKLGRALMGLVS